MFNYTTHTPVIRSFRLLSCRPRPCREFLEVNYKLYLRRDAVMNAWTDLKPLFSSRAELSAVSVKGGTVGKEGQSFRSNRTTSISLPLSGGMLRIWSSWLSTSDIRLCIISAFHFPFFRCINIKPGRLANANGHNLSRFCVLFSLSGFAHATLTAHHRSAKPAPTHDLAP